MDGSKVLIVFFGVFWVFASLLSFLAYIHYKLQVETFDLEVCQITAIQIKNLSVYVAYLNLTFKNLTDTVEVLTNSSYSGLIEELNQTYKLNQLVVCYISDLIYLFIDPDQSLFIAGVVFYILTLLFLIFFLLAKFIEYKRRKDYLEIEEALPTLENNNPNHPRYALESFAEAQRLLWYYHSQISNFALLRKFQVEALIDAKYEEEFQRRVYNALLKI